MPKFLWDWNLNFIVVHVNQFDRPEMRGGPLEISVSATFKIAAQILGSVTPQAEKNKSLHLGQFLKLSVTSSGISGTRDAQ